MIGGNTARSLMLRNYGDAKHRGYASEGEIYMQIGEPIRTVVVEPLELPVSEPQEEPEPSAPETEPEREPATK